MCAVAGQRQRKYWHSGVQKQENIEGFLQPVKVNFI